MSSPYLRLLGRVFAAAVVTVTFLVVAGVLVVMLLAGFGLVEFTISTR